MRTRKDGAFELSKIKTQIKLNAQYSREEEIEEGIEKEKRRRIKEIIFDILFIVWVLVVFGFILVLAGSMLGMVILVIAFIVVSILEVLTYIVVDIAPMKKMRQRQGKLTSKGEVWLGATIIGLNIFSLLVICFSLTPSAEFPECYTHSEITTIAELSLFLQFFVGMAVLLHGLCTVRYVEMAIGFLFIPWGMFACMETATILHSKGNQTADLFLIDIILIFLILTTGIFLGVTLIWDGKRKQ